MDTKNEKIHARSDQSGVVTSDPRDGQRSGSARPEGITDEHLEYLDELRDSGVTNMYGAPRYVQEEFDVDFEEAGRITSYWMKTFGKGSRR